MTTWTKLTANTATWAKTSKTLSPNSFLLLEDGTYLLLETGDKIILEQSVQTGTSWIKLNKS